ERARLDKLLANNEITNLIKALGVGIEDSFDVSQLRYHRIVIMTDADVDGSHISTLLLTFFFRHMQAIIEGGYLYLAKPPLFMLKGTGNKRQYAYSDDQLEEMVDELIAERKER